MSRARRSPSTVYQRIWQAVRAIPPGRVASYGQIAALVGLPRQARLVGYALHRLPADSALPWHRVITARGALAFPEASADYARQQALLRQEGVELIAGRVDLRRFGWRPEGLQPSRKPE